MLVTVDCVPCYLQQAINTLEKGGVKEGERSSLIKKLLPLIGQLPDDRTPAENSSVIIHRLVEMTGGEDPFKKAKKDSNQQALSYVKELRKKIAASDDSLFTALKISVAGNVIDLGIFDDFDLASALEEALKTGFVRNDYDSFVARLKECKKLLIIGDNSGEIVFDKLLVEQLTGRGVEVIYGVKGGFVLNDATLEDAEEAGLTHIVKVIDNGNNFLGTIEEYCSQAFLEEVNRADMIISKGQANYESLEGTQLAGDKSFFLLKAKCPVVAGHLGVNYGDIVFAQNN